MKPRSDERSQAVEPRVRGELGYADWCIRLIDADHCSCDGCGGHLADTICLSCGCRHYVQEPTKFHGRHSVWIPVYEAGRCSAAEASAAEQPRDRRRVQAAQQSEE